MKGEKLMDDYKIDNTDAIVYLRGEIDHHTVKKMMELIDKVVELYIPKSLTLDFAELTFMDSSGIALILKSLRRMEMLNGRITIKNVKCQPSKVINASGIARLVTIE